MIPHEKQSKFYGLNFLLTKPEFKNLNFIESYERLKANSSYKNILKRTHNGFRGIKFDKSVNLDSSILKIKKSTKFVNDTSFIAVLDSLARRYNLITYYSQGYIYIGSIEDSSVSFILTPTIKDYFNKRLSSLEDIENHLLKVCNPSYLSCQLSHDKQSIFVEGTDLEIRQLKAYFFLIETANLENSAKGKVRKNKGGSP